MKRPTCSLHSVTKTTHAVIVNKLTFNSNTYFSSFHSNPQSAAVIYFIFLSHVFEMLFGEPTNQKSILGLREEKKYGQLFGQCLFHSVPHSAESCYRHGLWWQTLNSDANSGVLR